MGFDKALFLQMQLKFVAHLKLTWHPMLIMPLFVFGIIFIQGVMNLLEDGLNVLNKPGSLIIFGLNMGILFLCSCKGKYNTKGT